MLTRDESENCRAILWLMADKDVFSLMRTTTNNAVSPQTRREAENAILNFTQSLDEFFKRKKITKELLALYIYKRGWPVPKGEADTLKSYIMQNWKSGLKRSEHIVKPESAASSAAAAAAADVVADMSKMVPSVQFVHNDQSQKSVSHHTTIKYNIINYTAPSPEPRPANLNSDHVSAVQFLNWFYTLLNSHNPDLGPAPGDFGPHHFWADSSLQLTLRNKTGRISESHQGNDAVAGKLMALPKADRLLFSLSTSSDGVKCSTDPFGRKMILACGLVHKAGTCVGTFCQGFGLLSDPLLRGSYKIRHTVLVMEEGDTLSMPSLTSEDALAIEEATTAVLVACKQE